MSNLEVLNKVKALLEQAIVVMDDNKKVFNVETIDVEDLYQTLENLVNDIDESNE
jgi:hypothetical protein